MALSTVLLSPAALAWAKSNPGYPGFRTWYAADQFNKVAPEPGVNWKGDAGAWAWNAFTAGWKVVGDVKSPRTSAMAAWGGLAHVAFVVGTTSKGITVNEMNWGGSPMPRSSDPESPNYGKTAYWNKVTSVTLTWDQIATCGSKPFAGYIYPVRDQGRRV